MQREPEQAKTNEVVIDFYKTKSSTLVEINAFVSNSLNEKYVSGYCKYVLMTNYYCLLPFSRMVKKEIENDNDNDNAYKKKMVKQSQDSKSTTMLQKKIKDEYQL